MGTMKIIKEGDIPLLWYGHCKYCDSVMEYKRSINEKPPMTEFKKRCPLCDELIDFYCIDTDRGRSIKDSVPISERSQTKTIKYSVPLNI
jgi:predicted DCC family thiol-disulfide oxidoreductase YuxK